MYFLEEQQQQDKEQSRINANKIWPLIIIGGLQMKNKNIISKHQMTIWKGKKQIHIIIKTKASFMEMEED